MSNGVITIRTRLLFGAITTLLTLAAFLLAVWSAYTANRVKLMDDATKAQIQRTVEQRIKAEMDERYVTQRELDGVLDRLDAIERSR